MSKIEIIGRLKSRVKIKGKTINVMTSIWIKTF